MGLDSPQGLLLLLLFLCMSAGFALQLAARLSSFSLSSASRRLGPHASRIAKAGAITVQQPHIAVTRKRERVIIVGDVHGCLDELLELLQKCGYDKQRDELVLVGDLVNKGPKSVEVVQHVRKNNILCVRGNHDDSALCAALRIGKFAKELPESYNYVKDFTDEDLEFLSTLPLSIHLTQWNALVAHAGVVPGVSLDRQSHKAMTRMRNLVKQPDGTWADSDTTKEGVAWVQEWKGPLHVYFGHDAKRGLQQAEYATGLDTGCCYGRQLTSIILPSRELVQVQAHKMYVDPLAS